MADDLTHRFLANSTYDAAGQLTGMCVAWGSCTTYANSPQGERLTATTGTATVGYGYDQASRLTTYTATGITAGYSYDGDGLRATTTGTNPATFTWDRTTGTVPLLLTDGTSRYLYGPGDLPVAEITGGSVRYLHTDQAASIRLATDTNGAALMSTTTAIPSTVTIRSPSEPAGASVARCPSERMARVNAEAPAT